MDIGIDPSSTVTGFAAMEGSELLRMELWKPPNKWSARKRVRDMADSLEDALCGLAPQQIIIEMPGGKVWDASTGAGHAIYGWAVGYIFRIAEEQIGRRKVVAVAPGVWTRGKTKKQNQSEVAMQFPSYDIEADPGGDVSDAIGLCFWWQAEQRLKRAKDV